MSDVETVLLRLRTGSRKACEGAIRAMTTDAIQGLEHEMLRAHKSGTVTDDEWRRFLEVKNEVVLYRSDRGET